MLKNVEKDDAFILKFVRKLCDNDCNSSAPVCHISFSIIIKNVITSKP